MSWKFPEYQNDKIMSWCVMIGNESAGQKYALYKFVWNNKLGCVEIWIRRTSSFLGGGVKKDRYLVTWWGSIQANVTKQVPKMSQVGYHLRDNWDVTSSDKDVISSEENSIRNNNCSYRISVQSYLLPIQVKVTHDDELLSMEAVRLGTPKVFGTTIIMI